MSDRVSANLDHVTADLQALAAVMHSAREHCRATQRAVFDSRQALLAMYSTYATACSGYPGAVAVLRRIRDEALL